MQSKIELDLKKSTYECKYKGLSFKFSSEFNLKRFCARVENYIKEETLKLKYRYGNLTINFDLYFAVSLYKKLERRGFLIYDGNIEIKEDTLFLICYKAPSSLHF